MVSDSGSFEEKDLKTSISEKQRESTIDAPSVTAYPIATYERYQLSSQEVDALVKNNPGVILELIQENQRQQRESQEQKFELDKIKLEYEHQIRCKKEENRVKSEQQNKNVIYLGSGAFCAIFAGTLIYSARVNDKNLPNTVITAAISLLAGGSTSVIAFSKRSQKKDNEEEQNFDESS